MGLNISGFTLYAGDDFDVIRTVTGVPVGTAMVKAWLTIKRDPVETDPGLLQKVVSTTPVLNVGQITNDGGSGGVGSLIFGLTKNDTLTLGPGIFYYDIQVLTGTGKIYTYEWGQIALKQRVTAALS